MKKDISHIQFDPSSNKTNGFEIVPLERLGSTLKKYDIDSEKPHPLKFYNLLFFTSGESEYFIDFKWYSVKKNSLIYLSKEQVNAFRFSGDLKGYCIIFTQEYFHEIFLQLPKYSLFNLFTPQLFFPVLQLPKELYFNEYLKLLHKEYSQQNSFIKEGIIKSLFMIILSKAEQLKQTKALHNKDISKIKVLQKFMLLLQEKFKESRSASFYAKELTITYKHLNLICKELINKTAKAFIDDFLTLQAKRKLIGSDIKSSELAYFLGFEDPTNFSKYFKKQTGFTPKSFKKKYK